MRYTVYCIVDPVINEVRYVGQTRDFSARRESHMIRGKNAVGRWIGKILAEGGKPEFVKLQMVKTRTEAFEAEKFWVAIGLERGWPLLNAEARGEHDDGTGKVARIVPERAGQPWSDDEDSDLLKMAVQGRTIEAMASAHKRSRHAISKRLRKLKRK